MAHSHSQEEGGHSGHDHAAGANSRSLTIALALTGTFLVAELVGAWLFNSLALLSDAAHMFTDAAALAIALAAIRIGRRPADVKRTYGYRRFEILAAAFNALLLFAVAAYILYEGIKRFVEPQEVQSLGMLAVAAAGLIINLVSMRMLSRGKDESLNVKGAYLEVWADMLGSLGVIGAAILISPAGAGSTRSSRSRSVSGCCRGRGFFCATPPISCCKAFRAASILGRCAEASQLSRVWPKSMTSISGPSLAAI